MLVLPRGGIYEMCHGDDLWWHAIPTEFHEDWFRHSRNIQVFTATVWEAVILLILKGGIMKCATEMSSHGMICMLRFMTIGTGVQAIIRFCLSNMRGNFMKTGSSIQKLLGGGIHTHTQTARWSHEPAFIFFKIRNVELGVVSADFLWLCTNCSCHIIQMWMCVIFICRDLWKRKSAYITHIVWRHLGLKSRIGFQKSLNMKFKTHHRIFCEVTVKVIYKYIMFYIFLIILPPLA
jgi:hypothetical protein